LNTDDLKNLLIKSLNQSYKYDKHLYDKNICERSKVFRIGLTLSQIINPSSKKGIIQNILVILLIANIIKGEIIQKRSQIKIHSLLI